jgi:hypothetical protein
MPNIFHSVTSVVLICCMVASSASSAPWIRFSTSRNYELRMESGVSIQAITQPATVYRQAFSTFGALAVIALLAGPSVRAMPPVSGHSGHMAPPRLGLQDASSSAKTLQSPRNESSQNANVQAEQMRDQIRQVLRVRNNFRDVIDRMFQQELVDPALQVTALELHGAVAEFVQFVEQATIVADPSSGENFMINPVRRELIYNPARWHDPQTIVGASRPLHEAVHLTKTQKRWFNELGQARDWLLTNRPGLNLMAKPRLIEDREFQTNARKAISARWKAERQAVFLQMAFIEAQAKLLGYNSASDYVLADALCSKISRACFRTAELRGFYI